MKRTETSNYFCETSTLKQFIFSVIEKSSTSGFFKLEFFFFEVLPDCEIFLIMFRSVNLLKFWTFCWFSIIFQDDFCHFFNNICSGKCLFLNYKVLAQLSVIFLNTSRFTKIQDDFKVFLSSNLEEVVSFLAFFGFEIACFQISWSLNSLGLRNCFRSLSPYQKKYFVQHFQNVLYFRSVVSFFDSLDMLRRINVMAKSVDQVVKLLNL